MLVALCEYKLPPFSDTGKYQKVTTDFKQILTFSLARWFSLVLSLGATTPLITPVIAISLLCIFGKECFDMLKSIGFGNLVSIFSSSRRSDGIYLGRFVRGLIGILFKMQALRSLVKAHWDFVSISFFLSTGFQVYLSKSWDAYLSPGCATRLALFCGFSALFQHVDLATTSCQG